MREKVVIKVVKKWLYKYHSSCVNWVMLFEHQFDWQPHGQPYLCNLIYGCPKSCHTNGCSNNTTLFFNLDHWFPVCHVSCI